MRARFGFLVAAATVLAMSGAQAQPAAEFFKGKTLRFTVVYDPGGTYDLYSRLLGEGTAAAPLRAKRPAR